MAGLHKSDVKNPVLNWIDTRLPVVTMIQKEYGVFPTPRNFNYFWNFGALATINPIIAPSCGIIAYQPRRFSATFMAKSGARPSQAPPQARPCAMRKNASSQAADGPIWSWPGTKAMATVAVPSKNSAIVSLTPRPATRSMAVKMTVPKGRAMKASEKIANE